MLHLLKDIPREIRDEIYEYAFETPYSCVTFRVTTRGSFHILPYDPQNDTCLSTSPIPCAGLLSTCTQIYNEAARVLWKRNALGLWPSDIFCNWAQLPEKAFENVQQVQVNLDLTDRDDVKWAQRVFERFAAWERVGCLKAVTINPIRGEELRLDVKWMERVEEALAMKWKNEEAMVGNTVFGESDEDWKLYGRWMDLFRDAGGDGGYFGGLQKKIAVNTYWDEWTPSEQRAWLWQQRWGDVETMESVMEDMHKAFGGELWANGRLRYKGEKKVERVFTLKPAKICI